MFDNTVEGLYIAVVRAAVIKHVTPHVAHQVLFEFGKMDRDKRIGYPAGSFVRKLIIAIMAADDFNLAKIGMGFPEYAAAVQLLKNDDHGATLLREIIIGDSMAQGLNEQEFKREQNAPREAGSQP